MDLFTRLLDRRGTPEDVGHGARKGVSDKPLASSRHTRPAAIISGIVHSLACAPLLRMRSVNEAEGGLHLSEQHHERMGFDPAAINLEFGVPVAEPVM